jgi:hypothetical protein
MRSLIFILACHFSMAVVSHTQGNDGASELSVENAKRLAQDKSGRLLLNGLKTLAPDVAKELARHEGWLSLNGLTSLSNETAEVLGQHKGFLHLDGLTKISDEAAKALTRHNGELSLNGLTSLSNEAAGAFASHSGGRLYLKGVTSLSAEAIEALAQRKAGVPAKKGSGPSRQVRLDGLTSLSAEAAAALAQTTGQFWDGRLPAMKTLPDDVARELAKRQGRFSFEGLTTISDEAATALQGKLDGDLRSLTSLSVVSGKAIAGAVPGQQNRTLILDGLTALPDEIALVIGGKDSRGSLHLNCLKTLTPIAAKAICQREADLYLNGLTTISDDTLKALAEHKAPGFARPVVYLKGLTTISDEGAAILAAWPKWCGELPALTTLSEKSAAALASSRKWNGNLPSLKMISPKAGKALAQRQGNLSLDGLTSLSEETAIELAKHQGGTLSLNGLKELSDNSAVVFAQHDGRLSLNGLTALSNGTAASLGKHKGDWLFLDGLTTLSDDGAKSLAQHSGIVSLKGLQKVSGSALNSLKSNSRVALAEKLRAVEAPMPTKADAKFVGAFLEANCVSCHSGKRHEGDFSMDALTLDNIAGRVAYASILERLRAGDMPPSVKDRPDPAESAGAVQWISAQLDTPFKGPAIPFAVKEKPVDGNRLPHAILFGGPRGPSVPLPPRLWRLSPSAYTKSLGALNVQGLQQPFGLIQDSGFRDFSALYAPDEGASSLLLTNAEQVVLAQLRPHTIVNIIEKPEAAKETLWPNGNRIKAATAEERNYLEKGDRVRQGNGVFAPLMHPKVAANRDELVTALNQQYQAIIARTPNEKELESLLELYKDVAREGDYSLAGKTILMAPLMTPEAILRFEIGLGAEVRPGVRMLSPRETAFALSLALSDKRDLGLLSAAAQGKLTTREEVVAAVRNILDDPKQPTSRILGFFREYFDYYRAPEVFKDPLPDYLQRRGIGHNPQQYVANTDILILNILGRDRETLKQLLTTEGSFRSNELFRPDSPAFRALPPTAQENQGKATTDQIGILMQPSWLVAWSVGSDNDIVRRGRWVREKLLGGRVPDLPINVQAMVPEDPHRTLRQRQMVTRAGACWKCHYRMDDLGTPFEHVDHYGRPRTAEPVLDLEALKSVKDKKAKIYREAPLDTTGFILHSGDPKLDGPVQDAPEMLRRLADSERVRQVFIRHAFRYFLGRNETPGDAPTLQEADRAYIESGGSFKALVVSLLSSESFLYRTIPTMAKGTR